MNCRPERRVLQRWATALCAASLLAIGLPLAAQDSRSPAQNSLAAAERFAAAQNDRAARVELLNAVQKDPDLAPARIALAAISLRLADPDSADAALRKAIDLGASPAQLRHLLGETYRQQRRYDEALSQLEAADIAPEHRAEAARYAGRTYQDLGNADAARAAFDRALALGDPNAELWTDIGRFRLARHDIAGAADAAERAVAIDGRDAGALGLRGETVRAQFGLAAALPWFEQGLRASPDNIALLEAYGATLGDLGRHREMLAVARRIVALQPGNPNGYFMQAVIAARAHEFGLAKRLIGMTDGQMNTIPAMLLLSGSVEYGLGNDLLAAEYWGRLAEMQPLNRTAAALAARALYRAGDAAGAAQMLPVDAASDTGSYGEWVLARSFEALGNRDAAMAMLNRAQVPGSGAAVLPGPGAGPAADVRARIAAGNFAGARLVGQALAERNPGVADAQILLGDVLAEQGDARGAMAAYGRAAALDFSPSLMQRMVAMARAVGDEDAALGVLVRFLQANPASLPARRLLAETYLAAGANEAAAALYRDLIAVIGPNDAMLHAGYARALSGAGRAGAALDQARRAYRVQPGNPEVVHIYGYVALQAGEHEEAREILEKAVAMLPDNPLARRHLAMAEAALRKD